MSAPRNPPQPTTERRSLDVVCLGRLAVDLYAEQLGARLEDASSFAKYLGGSSANVAFGCARLGLRAAMLSRVGDDHMGRFLTETLAAEGCDVSHVSTDPRRLTGLVLLGIKDRETFPLIFYRENCADMAIEEGDVDEGFIAGSRALAVTGTHLSTEHAHRIATLALGHARRHGVRTVLDIDYRPVLWGLTGPRRRREALRRERPRHRAPQVRPAALRPGGRDRGGVPHRRRRGGAAWAPCARCAPRRPPSSW